MNIADHHLESSHSEQEQSPYEDHIELEEPKIDESIVNDEQNTQYESKQQELSNEALEPMRQSSSDQNTLSPDTGKGKYTESDEIYLSPMTNAKTVDTDNEQFRTVSKMSKASSRKSINSSTKNFIAENKKVKTSQDVKKEYKQMRERRDSMSASRGQIQWTQLRKSIGNLQDLVRTSRQHEWQSLNLKNSLLSQTKTSQLGTKNQSKDFVVKHVEISYEDLMSQGIPTNNKGGTFSKNKKERCYHLTNSSSIPNLQSYKALDIPETEECREFPTTKGNQRLKYAMNQSNVFPKTNMFLKDEQIPDEFECYQSQPQIVHNLKNTQVQCMRMKNYYSQVL